MANGEHPLSEEHGSGPAEDATGVDRTIDSYAAPPDMRHPLPPQPPKLSVLIVEDNEDSRNMLRDLLRLDGYHVLTAEDGTSGLRAIETQRPDVALIDIGLPGISGYEVAETVRQKLHDDKVQLVALTGYGRAEDRLAVREAGFDEHLVKPLNLDDLGRVLKKPQ